MIMASAPGMKRHIQYRMNFTLKAYEDKHDEGADAQIRDLLCDIMHYCAANDIDFDHELSVATDFFGDEQEGVI